MERVLLKEEEVPGDGSTSGIGMDRQKRHRKGNKKDGRTKKRKGGEPGDEVVKPKSGEAMEEMPASKEKGGKRSKTKMLTLRSPPYFQESLETEIECYMAYEPRSTPLEMHVFGVGTELQEAAACILKELEFRADLYRQYRINGFADVQLEVPEDDSKVMTQEPVEDLQLEVDEVELTHVPIY